MKKLFYISLFLNILLISGFFVVVEKFGGIVYVFLKLQRVPNGVEFEDRKSHFDSLPDKSGEIVFFGNSITARGNWNELFNSQCINRGVGGDDIYRLYDRCDEIIKRKPDKVFIEIGINDLSKKRNISNFIERYELLIQKFKTETPSTAIFLQSILPVNNKIRYNFRDNIEIVQVNLEIERLAQKTGAIYIDLYTDFIDRDGELKQELTTDGVHINGNGYLMWKNKIEPYVVSELASQ